MALGINRGLGGGGGTSYPTGWVDASTIFAYFIRNDSITTGSVNFDLSKVKYIYIVNWYANNNSSRQDVQLNTKNTEYTTPVVSTEYAVWSFSDTSLNLVRKNQAARCVPQAIYICYDALPPSPPQ